MLRVSNFPLLCRSASSTSNIGLPYLSSRTDFRGRDGSEGMIDNGAHQYTTTSGLAESSQIESHQARVLQKIQELTALKENIDARLRGFQDLYHKLEYVRAQQSTQHMPFTTTPTPYVPFTATSPYSTANASPHPFSQTANLSPNQGEMWNIPNHMSPPSTSQQSSTVPHAQLASPPLPEYTVHTRAGKKVFLCECGHEASRKGDMNRHRESLVHAKKNYLCSCGKSYTRRDSLLRHATTRMHTLDSHVFDSSY